MKHKDTLQRTHVQQTQVRMFNKHKYITIHAR